MNKKAFFTRAKAFVSAHKVVSAIVVIALSGGGYGIYSRYFAPAAPASYALAPVTRGALISSVSGSGQVAARQETSITSLVSADIVAVYASPGDEVRAGDAIARLDSRDALKAVSNAELTLENSRLSYQKAVRQNADQAPASASSDLAKAYQDGYNALANTLIDLPAIFSGMDSILYDGYHSPYFTDMQMLARADGGAITYKNQAGLIFDTAKGEYQSHFSEFKSVSPSSSPEELVTLLDAANSILKKLLSSLTSTHGAIDYINDRMSSNVPSEMATDRAAIASYVSKVNGNTTSVTNALAGIDDARDSGATAELSMKSAELSVRQDEDALTNAREALADHVIRAPYDGLVAKVSAEVGDKATNGTAIATMVTKDQIVDISLNEIDAAKVKKGDAVALTFDAIDDLTLPGHVGNVDIVGTVSQGVVTYQAEIAFDAIDARVKPGMSVSASITTSVKEGVLMVPSSAVKSQGRGHFVQVTEGSYAKDEMVRGVAISPAPLTKKVSIGDSNDTMTEITEGLSEGELVVTRTIAASGSAAAPSIFSSLGGRTQGSGAIRTITR